MLVLMTEPGSSGKAAVTARVSVALMKRHDQKQVGEERVYLTYTST